MTAAEVAAVLDGAAPGKFGSVWMAACPICTTPKSIQLYERDGRIVVDRVCKCPLKTVKGSVMALFADHYGREMPELLTPSEAKTKSENGEAKAGLEIVTAEELLKRNFPPREMMLAPIIPVKGLAMLYGPRGLGKTYVALGIAYAVASGGAFLKWQAPKARRVLYIDGEMPAATMQERVAMLAVGPAPEPGMLRFLLADLHDDPLPDLGTEDGQGALELQWGETPPDLLIIDNLSCLASVVRDNDAESWSPMQTWLLRLRRRQISVLLVHHAGKGGQQRGTSRREDVLDTTMALRRPSDYSPAEGARFEVHLEKARGVVGEAAEPFEAKLQTDEHSKPAWTWKSHKDAMLARASAMFSDGITVRDAAEELGISRSAAGRLHKQAKAGFGGDNG